jgi:hypothetical protein
MLTHCRWDGSGEAGPCLALIVSFANPTAEYKASHILSDLQTTEAGLETWVIALHG